MHVLSGLEGVGDDWCLDDDMDLQIGQIIHLLRPEANNTNDGADYGAWIVRARHMANGIGHRLNGSWQDSEEHGARGTRLLSNVNPLLLVLRCLGSSSRPFRSHRTAKLRTSQPEKALTEPRGFRSFTSSATAALSSEDSPFESWLEAKSSLRTMSSFTVSLGKDMEMVDVVMLCKLVTRLCKISVW